MIRGRVLTVLAAFQLACLLSSPASAVTRASDPGLRSSSVLILDATRSSVIYSRRSNVPVPIASITKLMTSLVVLDARQSLDEKIKVTADDRSQGKGAFSRLAIGTTLTRGELMRLALMSSENRAAHALGRSYPGGLAACVKAMNAKARQLGMKNAKFIDPAGLSPGNVASADDLAKLVAAAGRSPTISEYSTAKDYTVRMGRQQLPFHNTNPLVRSSAWNIVVQKTGYLAEAGRCLVMQTVIDGRSVVIVLLNSFGKYTRTADARRIRRWMESGLNEA
jgi:D-alanyl-D-alanine endopeptidase (penicillin-binding protein 7)